MCSVHERTLRHLEAGKSTGTEQKRGPCDLPNTAGILMVIKKEQGFEAKPLPILE